LNKEAVFPKDDFAPDPNSIDFLVPEAGYDDVSDEGRTVSQTRFNNQIGEETDAIMRRSPLLAKKKPPQPTHCPQMPPEVRRSLRNRNSTEVMSLAVFRIMREHEDDPDLDKAYPQTVPDAIRKARAEVKRRTNARFLEGALVSSLSRKTFRKVPALPISTFINPLPLVFNPKKFAYLCTLDQVYRELKKDDCLPIAYSVMDFTAMLTV
jgi:hypothetical protein